MAEQVVRDLGSPMLVEIGGACNQLMPIGQDPARDQRRIPERSEPEHQVHSLNYVIDILSLPSFLVQLRV